MTDSTAQSLPTAASSAKELPDRPSAFYNALLTEHFVLESARGITVSESTGRSSLYLMSLSSSLVAFGFLATTPYALGFLAVIVPVVFVLGIFTYERLIQTSLEDVAALAAIQRIRRYYMTLLPEADHYFDVPGGIVPNEMLEIGQQGYRRGVFFTVSSAIGIVNSMVAGAGITTLISNLQTNFAFSLVAGLSTAIGLAIVMGWYQESRYSRFRRLLADRSDTRKQ